MSTAIPHLTDEDGGTIPLPYRFEICRVCRGHGKSSAYLGAYTADEMDEQGPDFHDDYMAGVYDRTCDACEGDGKVMVADRARMTKAQIAEMDLNDQLDADDAAYSEAERRMGC